MNPSEAHASLAAIVGSGHVLTDAGAQAPFLTDWRKQYTGSALAVVLPSRTEEVARIVHWCADRRLPIVPQGGNTGLVGGATPDNSGRAVVIATRRLNRVRAVDLTDNSITAEAGVLLVALQEAAHNAGRLFPLSLASEGSCTIGGNLSSNAGGTGVLRYGNARELCLGIEAVTAQGEIIGAGADGRVRGLRKDNTGYDLKNLFIGAEGTLGIITAATMRLYPQPRARITTLAAVPSPRVALQLLTLAQGLLGESLTAFELVSDLALTLVERHFGRRSPFDRRHAHAVLIEISDREDEAHATRALESLMQEAMRQKLIVDAVIAQSLQQSREFWQLREFISEAQAAEGRNIKHDIAVPVSRIADFIESTDARLKSAFPGCVLITFGHLGDGNLHYNVAAPAGVEPHAFDKNKDAVNLIVHDSVAEHGGSISAEHGLGQLKREEIKRYKPAQELAMMRAIKAAIDPLGIMNPGKVL
jgi:FAD/FMN-containing dehydrogenase